MNFCSSLRQLEGCQFWRQSQLRAGNILPLFPCQTTLLALRDLTSGARNCLIIVFNEEDKVLYIQNIYIDIYSNTYIDSLWYI